MLGTLLFVSASFTSWVRACVCASFWTVCNVCICSEAICSIFFLSHSHYYCPISFSSLLTWYMFDACFAFLYDVWVGSIVVRVCACIFFFFFGFDVLLIFSHHSKTVFTSATFAWCTYTNIQAAKWQMNIWDENEERKKIVEILHTNRHFIICRLRHVIITIIM